MIPSPNFLQNLARSRLITARAVASVGIGERRSRAKGAGMEFAAHREYVAGDDLRHLDPHIFARLGQHYIRQYEVHMQLPVTILIDGSRSMNHGTPSKLLVAKWFANTLGFVALAGGDRARTGFWDGTCLELSPFYQGSGRVHRMFHWTAEQETKGAGAFKDAFLPISEHLPPKGLLILLSDWWIDGFEADLKRLGANDQEIWALQVVSPDELDPSLLGAGDVRLIDSETGNEIELNLAKPRLDAYRRAVEAWRDRLQRTVLGQQGRHLLIRTDERLERVIWQDMRRLGMIR